MNSNECIVGSIVDDLTVVGVNVKGKGSRGSRTYYRMRCNKCGREKDMRLRYLEHRVGTTHQACSNAVSPADARFYRIWQAMRSRTTLRKTQERNPNYIGISSEDYVYFIDFYDDFWEPYKEHVRLHGESNTTIDRIDSRLDYKKENMRWATYKIQNENKINKVRCVGVSPKGDVYHFSSQVDFAKEHNLTKSGINNCLTEYRKSYKGWTFSYET